MGYQAHCVVMEEISRASGRSSSICPFENIDLTSVLNKKEASAFLMLPTPSSA